MIEKNTLSKWFKVLCGTITISMVASLFVAGVQLAFNQWFGSSDLIAFMLWTLPYTLMVATMTWPIYRLNLHYTWVTLIVFALFLGVFTSLIWSATLVLFMGDLIHTLSLAGFYIWMFGGTAGFLYIFHSVKTTSDKQPHVAQPTWKTIIPLVVWPLGFIIVLFLIFFTTLESIKYLTEESQVYLIPQGYTGPVLIVYDQVDGQPPKYENKSRVYEIPINGVLLTQFSWPERVGGEFWYINEQGQRTEKILWDQNCRGDDSLGDPVTVCVTGVLIGPTGKNFPRHTSLIIGMESQRDQLAKGSFEWTTNILASLSP